MKLILYITMLPLLLTLASPIDDTNEFSLINIYEMTDFDFEIADGSDTYSAILFSDSSNPLTIPVKNMTISESTISSPFIIKTVFKTHKSNPACLFSIVDDGAIKLQLCLTPAGEHITRITLQIEDLTKKDDVKEVSFTYAGDLAAWTRMLLHVEDAKVTLYMNCVNIDASEYSDKVEDIHISEKAVIHLGHDGNGDNFFEGVIEKIILYTEADDARLDYINTCSDVLRLPASTDSGDRGDDSSPENLEIFMDKPGSSGGDPIKGEKGDRGDPGPSIQGPPGPQGPEGPPGSPGKQGEQGTCSCSESVVSNLLKTMPEMRGPPGDRGLRGEMGDRGTPGLTGKQGDQGERGPQGLKGDMGASGADGSSGKDGTPGSKGEPGVDGDQGPLGPPGPMGPPGPPGPKCKETEEAKGVPMPGDKGETGPIGPPGPTGPRGHSGERGEPGLKGDTGDKGQQGHTGPQGPRGEKGHQGEAGIDGRPGEPGTHGRHGENGSKGDKGDRGEIGIPGPPTKLTSLLDPKDAEENAEIIKQLRGPQGDMGPPGEQGEKGDTGSIGPMGPSGKDGRHGNHGERGPRGPEGQIGPVGLTGPKGEAGEPGPPGNGSISTATAIKGPKGNKGDRGKVGPRGPTGPTGKRGPSGSAGPKGDAGPQGVIGPPGTCDLKDLIDEKGNSVLHGLMPKGEKGERGLDGKPGEIGPPGTPGQCPNSCATSTGPPGPPGPPGPAVTGPKGEPGGIVTEKTFYSFTDGAGETYGTHGHKNDEDDVYTAMTVIYRTTQALFKRTSSTPLGTLAYVLREKTLLLRVENGWQYVVMGSILATEPRDPYTTTTFRPQPSHIESSTPYPKPRQPNERTSIRVAALNEPYSGKIYFSNDRTGRNAANYACHRESRMFGFDGNFVAFLTNKVEDLRHLVKMNRDKELPVVNIHGEVLFERWADMFNGSGAVFAKSANLYSFNRKNVFIDPIWPQKAVWHGGTLDGIRSTDAFCEEWQSDSPTQYGLASPVEYSNKLLDQKKYSCDNKLIVLCVEATAARRRQRHLVSRSRDHLNRFQHDNNIFRL